MKILIVDDDPGVVAGIAALLLLNDIDAECASDVDAAEALLMDEFFPVVLADVRLRTEEEGLRLLDAVRRISPRSRVASMTGFADPVTDQRLRERGAEVVLYKPLSEEELVQVLREMLGTVEAVQTAHATDEELYEATLPTLRGIARKRFGLDAADSEDLIQEAWLLFLGKRASVRAPKAWLSGALSNVCRQWIGRRVRERARTGEMVDVAVPASLDEPLAVHQALSRVDARTRALCMMIGLEQLSYDQVSAALGVPVGSVGPLYMRAKTRLRGVLSN